MLNGSFSIAMSVYQRVNLHFPMGFPMVFLWSVITRGHSLFGKKWPRPLCATNLAAEVGEATIKQISGVARHWARHCFSCRCNCKLWVIHSPYGSKHCLRRYLSLQIIVNYTPNTS